MGKKRLVSVLLLLAVMLTVTACNVARGSGDLITETRQVSDFDSISLSGSGKVIVTQGGSESLSIETDDNVMQRIEARVEGGVLKLGFKSGVNLVSPSQLTFYVGVDDLTGLELSGSGDIEAELIEADRLETKVSGSGSVVISDLSAGRVTADLSGSGEVVLAGEAAAQDVSLSGSGSYQAGDLCSGSVKVSVSGAGDATVCATETLQADASGSGSVNYYGRPSVNSSVTGSGSINSVDEK